VDDSKGKALVAIVVGLVLWRAIGESGRKKLWQFLEDLAVATQEATIREQAQQYHLASPAPEAQPISLFGHIDIPSLEANIKKALQAPTTPPASPLPKSDPSFEEHLRWHNVIRHPAVVVIVGKRGGGKSALAYRLLELFRYSLSPYLVGAPSEARKLLPDWIGLAPSLEELPAKSIALVDEAYLHYHARRSMAQESTTMSQLLNLSRQREQTLVFVTQEARQMDRNIASAASVVVFKDLGILQLEFDRRELRKIATEAQQAFASVGGDKQRWSYVYSPDADFIGLLQNSLPSFWKPSLSRIFASAQSQATFRAAEKLDARQKVARAVELRSRGYSYSQIASDLGVSKATVVNYLRGYPYKR